MPLADPADSSAPPATGSASSGADESRGGSATRAGAGDPTRKTRSDRGEPSAAREGAPSAVKPVSYAPAAGAAAPTGGYGYDFDPGSGYCPPNQPEEPPLPAPETPPRKHRFWTSASYRQSSFRSPRELPLVTTGSPAGASPSSSSPYAIGSTRLCGSSARANRSSRQRT